MISRSPQRPPSEQGVTHRPAERRPRSYGIDRYLGETLLEFPLVEDYLTQQQAEWICATLNASE